MDKRKILGSLAGLSLMLGTSAASAQMPSDHSPAPSKFQRIEQPLAAKAGVTAGGLALIGLELWWFLRKPRT